MLSWNLKRSSVESKPTNERETYDRTLNPHPHWIQGSNHQTSVDCGTLWPTIDRLMRVMDEKLFGAQIRRARLYEDITQVELAERANISPVTLANLETGGGSTLRTLLKVIRALDREDWLESLEPLPAVSPLALARAAEGIREPQRATRRRQPDLRGGSHG